ncbi:MAG: hypothetical protein Q4B63_09605 [Clostridium perfringens]|nr:hypothetical protein [Clostridium perfringens]
MNNKYEVKDGIVYITVLKKNGEELITKINEADLETVSNTGNWFAEWNKDYNNYIVQSISTTKKNKKSKPLKQSLQSVILDVNPKAPISHFNGDTLDNRRSNLEIVERNSKNEYEILDNDTIAITLKDKLGKKEGVALISKEDLNTVVNDNFSWVIYKNHGEISVISNTPEGRLYLDYLLMQPSQKEDVYHINLNPLDNRRENIKLISIEE